MDNFDVPQLKANVICDYNIDKNVVQKPQMPHVSWLKRLWYASTHMNSIAQIQHTTCASYGSVTNSVAFVPKLKTQYLGIRDARLEARNFVENCLSDLGFETKVNTSDDYTTMPNLKIVVSLKKENNLKLMRVFGPYFMFKKQHLLTMKPFVIKNR